MTISSPASGATTTAATMVVRGTTAPGATVEVASGQPGSVTNPTTVVSAEADTTGAFQATVPTPAGSDVITAAATAGGHSSGWAQVTVTGG